MIEFANPALLGGLAAAGAPLLVHFASRLRLPQQSWGAMRFLAEILARHRRRLALQHWLLMALRIIALACLALALARPRLAADPARAVPVRPLGSGTAAVLCLDDSPSATAGGGWAAMQALAAAYLDTLKPGDEVSLVLGSAVDAPPADPIYDLKAVRATLAGARPADVASDIPALVAAGRRQLGRHLNPHAELVVLSDGRDDGWPESDDARWAAARPRAGAVRGTIADPVVVVLSPPAGAVDDAAVAALAADREPVPAGRPVNLRARIADAGSRPLAGAALRLAIDGRVVEERRIDVPAGGETQVSLPATFQEPGAHTASVELVGMRDALPGDDVRALAVEALARMPVLLVEEGRDPDAGALRGPLGLLAAALDPHGDGGGFFAVDRAVPGTLAEDPTLLAAHRVAVLGGVRLLDPQVLAALERFVAGGGGLLVCAGPELAADLATRAWWHGGDGVLAAPLAPRGPAVPRRVARVDAAHPALGVFLGTDTAAAFPGGEVRSLWSMPRPGEPGATPDLAVLATLDDGAPLCVARPRGFGRSALIACAIDGRDGDLPLRPAFVPFIRGLVAHLGSVLVPPRNLLAGSSIAWLAPGGAPVDPALVRLEGPDGPVPLARGAWEGREALVSPPLPRAGSYILRPPSAPALHYAVRRAEDESRLRPLAAGRAVAGLAPSAVLEARVPSAVAGLFRGTGAGGSELWRALVIAALACLAAELVLSRAIAAHERRALERGGARG